MKLLLPLLLVLAAFVAPQPVNAQGAGTLPRSTTGTVVTRRTSDVLPFRAVIFNPAHTMTLELRSQQWSPWEGLTCPAAVINDGHFTASWETTTGITIRVDATQGPGETDSAFAARCRNKVDALANQFPPKRADSTAPPGLTDGITIDGSGTATHTGNRAGTGADQSGHEDTEADWWTLYQGTGDIYCSLGAEEQPNESDTDFARRFSAKLAVFEGVFIPE